MCQPLALMEALAVRAEAGSVDNVKVYYMHAEENMKKSLLRYELMGRIKPYCMFMQEAERDLIKRAEEDGGAKVVDTVVPKLVQSIDPLFHRRQYSRRHVSCDRVADGS